MTDPSRLHALADGQIEASERAEVERELQQDPSAAAEYRSILLMKQVMRTKLSAPESETVWKACVGRLDEIDRTKRAESFVTRYAWALCGVFLLAILFGGLSSRMNGDRVQTGDVARYVSSLVPVPGVGAVRNDVAQDMLREAMGRTPETVRLQGIQVTGVAEATVEGRRVFSLRVQDAQGPMALVVIPGVSYVEGTEAVGTEGFFRGQIDRMNCVAWSDRGAAMLLIADRPQESLQQVAARICVR